MACIRSRAKFSVVSLTLWHGANFGSGMNLWITLVEKQRLRSVRGRRRRASVLHLFCTARALRAVAQAACKPGSVPGQARGTAIHLGCASPRTSRDRPGRPARERARAAKAPSSLLGLAPGGVCRATRVAAGAVRSCRTLSPLPANGPSRPGGRSALCGTFPGVAPAGCCPAPCSRGARTFLPRRSGSGRPAACASPQVGVAPSSSKAATAAIRPIVSASSAPSTRAGRKCRWKAVTRWRKVTPGWSRA
jgi:hypothetical protein